MSKPTITKTWQHTINQRVAAAATAPRDVLLGIKNALTGLALFPWAVDSSCGGGVAGVAGDGVDRWATSASIVYAASAGTAHSWIVLTQVGLLANFQLCIDCLGGATSYHNANMYVSPAAGFTGGTTTARPTATDETEITQNASWTCSSTTANRHFHVMQSTDGECTRIFTTTGGYVCGIWILDKIVGSRGAITEPFAAAQIGVSTNTADVNAKTLLNQTTTPATKVRFSTTIGLAWLTGVGAYQELVTEVQRVADDIADECPLLPIGVLSDTAGARGYYGTLADIWWGVDDVKNGTTYDATNTLVQLAGLVVPSAGQVFDVR